MKKTAVFSALALCAASLFANIAAPWGGATELQGNGKFVCRDAKLDLVKGKSYRFDFKITKVPPLSAKNIEHQLVLYAVDGKAHKQIKTFAAEAPADGKTYQVSSAFTIPANTKGFLKLFVYNCYSKGTVKISDFKISELGAAEKISATAAAVKEVVKADPNVVIPALGNKQRALLEGNGRFLFLTEKIFLKAAQTYNISFDIRKVAPLSEKNIEHRLVLSMTDDNGKYNEFGHFGENVPVDGKWHKVAGTFTVPPQSGKYTMYIYNCNADGSMEVKNIRFTLTNKAAAKTPAPQAAAKVNKAPDIEVVGNGKFKSGHFHVSVKPNSVCTFNFKMMKTPKMSSNPVEQRVVVAYIPTKGMIREIAYIGENLPADSKWHNMKHSVKIPANSNGTLRIYVYNCKATGKIALKDFTWECK